MSLLHKLIGKDGRFFDLLEASAAMARECAGLLPQLLEEIAAGEPATTLEAFAWTRTRD